MSDRAAPVSRSSAPHYTWANACDGWRLIDTPGLTVVEERVPPGAEEMRHYHNEARQFFYVLEGMACFEIEGQLVEVDKGQGLQIEAGVPHCIHNRTAGVLGFLLCSEPSTSGDRINCTT